MRLSSARLSRFIITLLTICYMTSAQAQAETITIVSDAWCPYNCEPKSEKSGVLIEIAQKVFAKHNIKIDYKIVPWTRAIADTRTGQYNAIAGASKGDAPDFIFPATPQANAKMTFFVKAGNDWRYTNVKSLETISLGIVTNYSYGEPIDSYIRQHRRDFTKIQQVSGEDALSSNVKKLLMGRIDAFMEEENVAMYYLSTHNLTADIITAGGTPITRDNDLFLAFSPKDPESKKYADILSQETIAMKKSGALDKIMKRYGLKSDVEAK